MPRLLPALPALAASLCFALPGAAAAAPMPAKSAQEFADSVGVNVHASYTDTVYGD